MMPLFLGEADEDASGLKFIIDLCFSNVEQPSSEILDTALRGVTRRSQAMDAFFSHVY